MDEISIIYVLLVLAHVLLVLAALLAAVSPVLIVVIYLRRQKPPRGPRVFWPTVLVVQPLAAISLLYVIGKIVAVLCRPPDVVDGLGAIDALPINTSIAGLCPTAPHNPDSCVDLNLAQLRHFADSVMSKSLRAQSDVANLPVDVADYESRCGSAAPPPPWLFVMVKAGGQKFLKIDYKDFFSCPPARVPLFATLTVRRAEALAYLFKPVSYVVEFTITDTVSPYPTPEVLDSFAAPSWRGGNLGTVRALRTLFDATTAIGLEIGWGAVRSYYPGGKVVQARAVSRAFPDLTARLEKCELRQNATPGDVETYEANMGPLWDMHYESRLGSIKGPSALIVAVEYNSGRAISRSPWVFVLRSGIINVGDNWIAEQGPSPDPPAPAAQTSSPKADRWCEEDTGATETIFPLVFPPERKMVFVSPAYDKQELAITDFDAADVIDVYKAPDSTNLNSFTLDRISDDEIDQGIVPLSCAGTGGYRFSLGDECFIDSSGRCLGPAHEPEKVLRLHESP